MEVAGLAIGVASLYGACIEVAHRIESYRTFKDESSQLSAQFQADKALMQQWAARVGVSHDGLSTEHARCLDNPAIASAIKNLLSSIQTLLKATEVAQTKTRRRYGGHLDSVEEPLTIQSVYQHDSIVPRKTRRREKVAWTFGGKSKFTGLVATYGTLVRKLQDLTDNSWQFRPDGMTK